MPQSGGNCGVHWVSENILQTPPCCAGGFVEGTRLSPVTMQQTMVPGTHSGYSGVFPLCCQNVYDKNANHSCKACKCTPLKGNVLCEFLAPVYAPSFPLRYGLLQFFIWALSTDCRRKLLQSFLLCTEPDLFVCSAAKCKPFSSWGKLNWGSSSWTCCWDSAVVPWCAWGKRWGTGDVVMHWVCLAPDKNWVLLYHSWVNQGILPVCNGPGLCCARWEHPQCSVPVVLT